jgi:metal-dependent amidase/aminoacylase/carboxypeptidase family protein
MAAKTGCITGVSTAAQESMFHAIATTLVSRYHPGTMRSTQFLLLFLLLDLAWAQVPARSGEIENVYPEARALYLDIHQNPELSGHEIQTAAKLAGRLRRLGYAVTENVGGTGVVAILKNGAGPTVMLRTELDALPVEEKTGLPYASRVRTKDDAGRDVGVMHACGHDLHMASLFGTAAIMASSKSTCTAR